MTPHNSPRTPNVHTTVRLSGAIKRVCALTATALAGLAVWVSPALCVEPAASIVREESFEDGITTANLRAVISPLGADTAYHFEYGPDAGYGTDVPVPDATISGANGSNEVPVTVHVANLLPGTTYHFRIVASNVNGTSVGADETFTTYEQPVSGAVDTCPNAARRVGLSAGLPDCRAFELVSPVDKHGGDVNAQNPREFFAAASGERVEYPSRTGMAATQGSGYGGYSEFVAARGADGWSSRGLMPTPAASTPLQILAEASTTVMQFSEELDRATVAAYDLPGIAGAMPESGNIYLEDALTGEITEPITKLENPSEPIADPEQAQPVLLAGSADLGVVTFETTANLIPQAAGSESKLYAWNHGHVELVGLLPDGSVPGGGATGVRTEQFAGIEKDTVSRDGSRVFFYASARKGAQHQLYVREDGVKTVWISQPETGSRFVPGGVNFQMATPDGRHVVFTSKDPLLPVDTGGSGSGLYMYTDGPEPESESNLTFIGRVTALVGHESELVQGISDDGDYVYFLSGQATALFVWHDGEVHEVVPTNDVREEARVSPDGTRFVFSVPNGVYVRQTTNTEINLYDAKTETVKCISCPPNGETPISGVETDVTATSPSNPVFAVDVAPRFFSTDGKYVFFNTRESLVPQDTDGTTDAYEYDLETGKLSLLSSGTGETGTWFVEASADGRDAFLVTRQKLTGWDEDKLVDLYDARVEGGFPEPSPPLPPCLGDACQGTPSAAPTFNTASGFSGLGNLQVPQASKVSSKALTRSAALRKALRACGRRPKKARARCRARARKRYAAKSNAKRATRHAGR